ncbi:MAG TPA: flagellar hook-associated protein FlgK [Steroidobacteraceae bacterium]|nr:flagellar hook-associated protein FlgK [Steroidobacteraceae bacterium]
MLSTSVTGLLAFQNALDTISNNVSNVNTPGYSVENTNLVTNPSTLIGQGAIGNGVSVASTTRSYSNFLDAQTQSATSSYNQYNTVSGLASTVNNMLADSTTGLSATLQNFSQSLQTLANSPTQSASRSAVLNQLQTVVSQVKSYQSTYDQLNSQVNGQIQSEASAVTSLAQSIASVNAQIQTASAGGSGQAPNSLLDQRNNLIDQLSQHLNVSTLQQSDGTINVFVGTGQPLVVGSQASSLVATPDQYNSGQLDLALQSGNGTPQDVTGQLTGGSVGGLLQFRTQMLDPGESALGQSAVTLANLLNTQNAAGVDQNGNIGGNLLNVGGSEVLASKKNTGTAQVTGSVANLGSLTTDTYQLNYTAGAWSLQDTTTGTSSALTAAAGPGGTTILTGAAGLQFSVTGTPTTGDRFLVEPTGNAVSQLSLATTDPTKIAAGSPALASAASSNSGSATITSAVANPAAYAAGNYTITFTDATHYTVTPQGGAASAAAVYTSGSAITLGGGVTATISGTPTAGDTFSVNSGAGDNTNAKALAGILNQNVLNGGSESLLSAANSYVGTVGLQTSQAQNGATAQQAVLSTAQNAQQSVSGVNLDEEAAKMLQYQQAYQAAAQVISTSSTLFNSIISAIRGQ